MRPTLAPSTLAALLLAASVAAASAASAQAVGALPGVQVEASGWLGVMLDTQADGAVVTRPVPGSPAAEAGIEPGDVISHVDGAPVGSSSELIAAVSGKSAGTEVALRVVRGTEPRELMVTLAARPDERAMASVLIGQPFPFAEVTRVSDGERFVPAAGTPVTVVEFWATWCGPCHAAAPQMARLRERYPADRLTIVGISTEEVDHVREFASRSSMYSWTLAADPDGAAERDAFVMSLPTWFVLDASGTVLEVHSGGYGIGDVAATVERLLGPPAPRGEPGARGETADPDGADATTGRRRR